MSDDDGDSDGETPLKIELRLSTDGEWYVAQSDGVRSKVAYSLVNDEAIGRVTLAVRPPLRPTPGV